MVALRRTPATEILRASPPKSEHAVFLSRWHSRSRSKWVELVSWGRWTDGISLPLVTNSAATKMSDSFATDGKGERIGPRIYTPRVNAEEMKL